MNHAILKDMIRRSFAGNPGIDRVKQAWLRLGFIASELGHALVNVPRETLRALGAPDAPGDARNWADNLSVVVVVALGLALVIGLASLEPVPPALWVEP